MSQINNLGLVCVDYYKYIIKRKIWELIFKTIHISEKFIGEVKGYGLSFNLANAHQVALIFDRDKFIIKENYYID
jgi:hypothetical protein